MENSKTYKCLFQQFNASGSEKLDGYNSQLIEEIYDWEREEIEDVIWRKIDFSINKTILLNNESGVWNRGCFKDAIINRDALYINLDG